MTMCDGMWVSVLVTFQVRVSRSLRMSIRGEIGNVKPAGTRFQLYLTALRVNKPPYQTMLSSNLAGAMRDRL